MKWSFTGVGLIVFGLIGLTIIMLFEQITTSNENDYYLLKEITNAAMVDSIDIAYYRETGDLKIVREKFVENFTRRYSESTLFIGTKYVISFYDIMEIPPKVTILIDTGLGQYRIFNDVDNYNVQNTLTGILEYVGKNTKTNTGNIENDDKDTTNITSDKTYYSMPTNNSGSIDVTEPINLPKELDQSNIKIKKIEINYDGVVTDQGELLKAKLMREIDWSRATTEANYKTNYYDKKYMDINSYNKTELNQTDIKIYDCQNRIDNNNKFDNVNCEKYNNIWIHYTGTVSNNDPVIVKLKVTFTYDEYEYQN
ncbi:MAG: DUF5411 family protein [Bacilli bacterium]